MVSVLQSFVSKLPGKPESISFGINFSIGGRRSKIKQPIIKHEKARNVEGWPGSYYSWPTTFFRLGPLNGSIWWKPFDRLSEEEYFQKYGTHDAVEETRWAREKREYKEAKRKKAIDDVIASIPGPRMDF